MLPVSRIKEDAVCKGSMVALLVFWCRWVGVAGLGLQLWILICGLVGGCGWGSCIVVIDMLVVRCVVA